ncbi:hypothetical protein [Pseudomonas lopnurensis]|uniref:hypothetical protein n=1 Tax=Pseudomonas lopnurensis TaxID=1477517 RepID=UPI0028AC300F|nr:hypothetical protein [Pseudomonas lopnurensis]
MHSLFSHGPALPIDLKGDPELYQRLSELRDQLQSINRHATEAYPGLFKAHEAMKAAQKAFEDELAKTFPKGASVLVRHYSGQYLATVDRTARGGDTQVYVRNNNTGKVTPRYPLTDVDAGLCLEVLGGSDD